MPPGFQDLCPSRWCEQNGIGHPESIKPSLDSTFFAAGRAVLCALRLCAAKEGLGKPRSSARLRTNTALEDYDTLWHLWWHLCAVKICQDNSLLKRWACLPRSHVESSDFWWHVVTSLLWDSWSKQIHELPGSGPTGAMGQALGVWHCGPRYERTWKENHQRKFQEIWKPKKKQQCIWQILAVFLVLLAWEAESNQVLQLQLCRVWQSCHSWDIRWYHHPIQTMDLISVPGCLTISEGKRCRGNKWRDPSTPRPRQRFPARQSAWEPRALVRPTWRFIHNDSYSECIYLLCSIDR